MSYIFIFLYNILLRCILIPKLPLYLTKGGLLHMLHVSF